MKDAFASDFEATLKKMKWPGKEITLAGGLGREWDEGVKKLLDLQEPELKARDTQNGGDGGDGGQGESLVLLPLEVMARPLELRFKYHFEGERPTNKPDKVCLVEALPIPWQADASSRNTFFLTLLIC